MKKNTSITNFRSDFCNFLNDRGVTQAEAAKKTGLATAQICFFVQGKRGLSGDAVLRLQDFMKGYRVKSHATT